MKAHVAGRGMNGINTTTQRQSDQCNLHAPDFKWFTVTAHEGGEAVD